MNRVGQLVNQCEAPKTTQEYAITKAMDELRDRICQCQEKLEQLTQRLQPILTSCPPDDDVVPASPTPVRSPLADGLYELVASVDRITHQMQSILIRCEL